MSDTEKERERELCFVGLNGKFQGILFLIRLHC